MLSGTFADGTLGGLLMSSAYSKRKIIEDGLQHGSLGTQHGSGQCRRVSWLRDLLARFPAGERHGLPECRREPANPARVAVAMPPTRHSTRASPRYDYFVDNEERIGATASFQWKPSDSTLISTLTASTRISRRRVRTVS